MDTVLVILIVLAALVTVASGVWVATGLISAVASFKIKPPVPEEGKESDPL